jgi:hypothetical protein
MQRRVDNSVRVIQDLLTTNLATQLRPGDSLGIWTFNEKPVAGQFPLQRWSADAPKEVPPKITEFLLRQKFEKPAQLDSVLTGLNHVVEDSEFLTVILVLSGQDPLRGTPFDDTLNANLDAWRDWQARVGMPCLILLRSTAGKFTDWSFAAAPWPLELPPLPKALMEPRGNPAPAPAVSTQRTATTPAAVNKPTAKPPPLIISGRKPETAAAQAEKPIAKPTEPLPGKPDPVSQLTPPAKAPLEEAETSSSSGSVLVKTSAAGDQEKALQAPESPTPKVASPAVTPPPVPPPLIQAPTTEAKPISSPVPQSPPTSPKSSPQVNTVAQPQSVASPTPTAVTPPAQPPLTQAGSGQEPKPVSLPPGKKAETATGDPRPAPTKLEPSARAQETPAATPPAGAPPKDPFRDAAPRPLPVSLLWAGGGLATLAGLGLCWWWIARSRAAHESSLITEALKREQWKAGSGKNPPTPTDHADKAKPTPKSP